MTKKIGIAVALSTMALLAACNTVNGAGKDLKSAGSAVSDAASSK